VPGQNRSSYVLGIDLGSASLGWAVAEIDAGGSPSAVTRVGVRVFDPGVEGTDLSIQQGRDESKAVKRRQMRLQRRQLRRRAGRQRELFELLQQHGLLPPSSRQTANDHLGGTNAQRSLDRHEILKALDKELTSKWKPRMALVPAADHVWPYFLRASGLRERLDLFELGRALYHLGQRRGFKSNRRETAKSKEQEEEKSKVYAGISEISQQMKDAGAPSLGAFFASQDPQTRRIRGRCTARGMFEAEFDAIWLAQAAHYPNLLTSELRNQIRHLLFFQRPIAAQTHLVGECELEPGRKRAPVASLDAQRFRLLQKVNDLRIQFADWRERPLNPDEKGKLTHALETRGDLKFAEIRKLLGLPARGVSFNLEAGGEKKLSGNRTASKMLAAFADRWVRFSEREQEQIVEDWRTAETEDWLVRRGIARWGLDEGQAKVWAQSSPEEGYARLSRRALSKLLPLMEQGSSFKEAEKQIYGTSFSGGKSHDLLPPVRDILPALRNPAVERSLTELRKVVNAIVREYGKPHEIHIELARDLKRSRKDRMELWKQNRERQGRREAQRQEISQKTGLQQPSRADIERALLWEECGGICPYTGRAIPFASMFGDQPQFDVEHILPFGRCPDDSFANKTLCYAEENRNVKRGRTPWEAYGGTERWEEILERVKQFKNPAKLRRFQVKRNEELAEFTARQLNDTRYSSKLAAQYLGVLYGGRDLARPNGTSVRKIYASPGGLTAILRRNWGLEEILREPEAAASEEKRRKPRSDHRHHAIDAIVIALTSAAAVKALSDAVERNAKRGRSSFKGLQGPWPDFVDSVRPHIDSLIVSHRPERKLTGQLHDETLYSPPYEKNGKMFVHVRKAVEALTAGELEDIVDDSVREAVQKRAQELGGLKKLQAAGVEPPWLETNDGRRIPIRRVRVRKVLAVQRLSEGPRERYVAPNNTHHMEIVAELDEKEREVRWDGVPVSLLEAMERKRNGGPIVRTTHGPDTQFRFKFSLMGGDAIEIPTGKRAGLYVVRTLRTDGRLEVARATDARLKDEIKKAEDWWSPTLDRLRKENARKVQVSVLGTVHPAND
jgi:CRISPR-associated endonuclease Csn1